MTTAGFLFLELYGQYFVTILPCNFKVCLLGLLFMKLKETTGVLHFELRNESKYILLHPIWTCIIIWCSYDTISHSKFIYQHICSLLMYGVWVLQGCQEILYVSFVTYLFPACFLTRRISERNGNTTSTADILATVTILLCDSPFNLPSHDGISKSDMKYLKLQIEQIKTDLHGVVDIWWILFEFSNFCKNR